MIQARIALLAATLALGCRPAGDTKTIDAMGTTWKVMGGTWEASGGALIGSGGNLSSTESYGDATIDMDIELLSGTGGRTIGIGFRYQPTDDPAKGSGYGVNLTTGASSYNVFKGKTGDWRPVNPAFTAFQSSPAIAPGKNHLTIRSVGKSHSIQVNGKPLATFEDDAYPKGQINFWVESTAEKVKFSGFTVTK
jgi:hypothetical protein